MPLQKQNVMKLEVFIDKELIRRERRDGMVKREKREDGEREQREDREKRTELTIRRGG